MTTFAKISVNIMDQMRSTRGSFHSNTSSVFMTESNRVPTNWEVDTFLRAKNAEFLKSLAPTLGYLLFLLVAGLVGNTIVFLVYYRRFKPSVTRTYILAMCICDLLTNTLSLPTDVLEISFHNTFDYAWACKLARTIKSFLGILSACILVAVALDRYRKICRPFAKQASSKQVYIVLAVCFLVSFCTTLPYTVLTGCQTVRFEGTSITGYKCSIDDVYVKSLFLVIYNVITGLTFITCAVIMVTSYARIARQLWIHKKNPAVCSVTGRAGRRAEGKHGSCVTLQDIHTYTDDETSADRFGHSPEMRSVDDQTNHVEYSSTPGRQAHEVDLHIDQSTPGRQAHEVDLDIDQSSPGRQVHEVDLDIDHSTPGRQAHEVDLDIDQSTPGRQVHEVDLDIDHSTPGRQAHEVDLDRDQSTPGRQAHEVDLDRDQSTPGRQAHEVDLDIDQSTPGCQAHQEDLHKDLLTSGCQSHQDTLFKDPRKPNFEAQLTPNCQTADTVEAPSTPKCQTLPHEDAEAKEKANAQASQGSASPPVDCSEESCFSARNPATVDKPTAHEGVSTSVIIENKDFAVNTAGKAIGKRIKRTKSETDSSGLSTWKKKPSCIKKTSFLSKKPSSEFRRSVKKIPTRTTFMMFVLTAIFVVNYLPYLVIVSLRVRLELAVLVEMLGLNVYHIGLRSYFINSAVNPLVYGLCSARFQKECRRLFRCKTR